VGALHRRVLACAQPARARRNRRRAPVDEAAAGGVGIDDGQPEAARPAWRRRPAERRRGPAPVARVADGDRPAVRERGARQRQDGGGEEDHPGLVDIAAGCTAAAVLGSLRRSRRPSSSRTTNQARLAIVQRAPAPSTKAPEASTELPPSTTMTLPSVADVAGRSSAARRRDSTAGGDVL